MLCISCVHFGKTFSFAIATPHARWFVTSHGWCSVPKQINSSDTGSRNYYSHLQAKPSRLGKDLLHKNSTSQRFDDTESRAPTKRLLCKHSNGKILRYKCLSLRLTLPVCLLISFECLTWHISRASRGSFCYEYIIPSPTSSFIPHHLCTTAQVVELRLTRHLTCSVPNGRCVPVSALDKHPMSSKSCLFVSRHKRSNIPSLPPVLRHTHTLTAGVPSRG